MKEDERSFLLERYRGMETEHLIELSSEELTEVAREVLNSVIEERGLSSNQKEEIAEKIRDERSLASGPQGVRGWLALLVIGMILLGPLMNAGSINADIMMVESDYPRVTSLPVWNTYKTVTWSTYLVVIAISLYGGFGLLHGREWSVVTRAKIVLWIIGPLASIVMSLIIPLAVFGKTEAVNPVFFGAFIASVISASIWTAYLSKSKRVRNTYGGNRK